MTFNKASNSAVSALCTAGDSAWAIASTSRITRGHDVKNVEALTTFDRKRPTDFTGDRSSSTCMQVIFFTPPPPPSRASQRPHQRSLPQAYPRHTSTERSTTCKSGPHSGTLSCTTHQLAYHASEDSALVLVRDEFSLALTHTHANPWAKHTAYCKNFDGWLDFALPPVLHRYDILTAQGSTAVAQVRDMIQLASSLFFFSPRISRVPGAVYRTF